MSPVPVMCGCLSWSWAIGNFLLNCGTLEYFVLVFLKDHLPDDDFAKVKDWHLKDRLSRVAQYLKDENYAPEEQTAFARLVERLEPIRELRNHIAHGHLYIRLDEESQKATVTLFKAKDLDTGYLVDSKHVEFAELLAALGTISELLKEFEGLAGFQAE